MSIASAASWPSRVPSSAACFSASRSSSSALAALAAALLNWGVILPEERYLESKFGDTYLTYKRQVRRWI